MSFLEGEILSDEEINKQRVLLGLEPLKKETKTNITNLLEKISTTYNIPKEYKVYKKEFYEIGPKQLAIYRKDLFNSQKDWAEAFFEGDQEKIDIFLQNSIKYKEELENKIKRSNLEINIFSNEIKLIIYRITSIINI